jgi:hypothetical protein
MQGHVKVSPARWWHVPGVAHLIRESRRQRFSGECTLVWAPRWSPSLGLLQSVWAAPMPGVRAPRSFVAEQDGRAVGLAQMRPRREPYHWEVIYLAVEPEAGANTSPDGSSKPRLRLVPDRRATRLAGELCDAGVLLGAERLFVRIPDDGAGYDVFRQVGFTPVVREFTYYRAPGGPPPATVAPEALPGLRPQRRADAFGVLQLYHECTPKVVQMAEGKRSQNWDLAGAGLGRHLSRRARAQRWVVERDARKVAWLQLNVQRRGPHQVRIMVSDRADDVLQPVLDFVLGRVAARPVNGVIVRVREHQPRLMSALEANGFEPVESHLLMVKQLAARVMQRGFVPALEKVV